MISGKVHDHEKNYAKTLVDALIPAISDRDDLLFFNTFISACSQSSESRTVRDFINPDDGASPNDAHYWTYISHRDTKKLDNKQLLTQRVAFNSSTPLIVATKADNTVMIRQIGQYFRDNGMLDSLNDKDDIGNTALMIAAEKGYTNTVELLVSLGANMLATNSYGMTALFHAIQADRLSTMKRLCDLAGDYLVVEYHDIPKDVEKFKRDHFYLKVDEDFLSRGKYPKLVHRKERLTDTVTLQPRKGQVLSELELMTLTNLVTTLHSIGGHAIIASDCLQFSDYEFKVSWNSADSDSKTIMWQTEDEILRIAGAPREQDGSYNETAAAEAARKIIDSYRDTLKATIKANVSAGTLRPVRVLSRRFFTGDSSGQYEVAWNDANVRASWHKRRTLEDWEGRENDSPSKDTQRTSIIGWGKLRDYNLLNEYDSHADEAIVNYLNIRNKYTKSAFMNACEFNRLACAKELLSHPTWCQYDYFNTALVDTRAASQITSLMFAVTTDHLQLVELLLEYGADPLSQAVFGDNSLHWASMSVLPGIHHILRALLENAKDRLPNKEIGLCDVLNSSGSAGKAPTEDINCLMRAAKYGNLENVNLLLSYGADPFARGAEQFHDKNFKSAADHAFESQHFEISYLLDPVSTLNKLRRVFQVKCEANVVVEYIDKPSAADVGMPEKGMRDHVFEDLLTYADYETKSQKSTEVAKIYKYTPPDSRGIVYNVKELHRYTAQQCHQNAFDYYMTRPTEFSYIAKMAAIDEMTFEVFVGIITNATIKEAGLFFYEILPHLYAGMEGDNEYHSQILWRVVKLYEAIVISRESTAQANVQYFDAELVKLDTVMQRMFECTRMQDSRHVYDVISKTATFLKFKNPVAANASIFYQPVMRTALALDISSVFGLQKVSQVVEQVFRGNLNALKTKAESWGHDRPRLSFRNYFEVLYKLFRRRRTDSLENLRYCPAVLFFLEGVSKCTMLYFTSSVVVYHYGDFFETVHAGSAKGDFSVFAVKEAMICLMWSATVLYEIGGFEGSTMDLQTGSAGVKSIGRGFFNALYDNFIKDAWNLLDLLSLMCIGFWIAAKAGSPLSGAIFAKTVLSVSAIPQSLGLLRYFAVEKEMGNLVLTVLSMSKVLWAFAVVYIVFVYGFGVALKAILQQESSSADWLNSLGFSSVVSTALTLFDATLGQHNYGQMSVSNPAFVVALLIEVAFLVCTMVVLFNLLVAKMTQTYEDRRSTSKRDWEFAKANIVREFVLVGEASPLRMMPAPLNLVSAALYIPHYLNINMTFFGRLFYLIGDSTMHSQRDPDAMCVSIAGTASDWLLGTLVAPLVALSECFYDVEEVYSLGVMCATEDLHQLQQDDAAEKRYAFKENRDFQHDYIRPVYSKLYFTFVTLSHMIFVLAMTPLSFFSYIFAHIHGISSRRVHLQFDMRSNDNIRIKYETVEENVICGHDLKDDLFKALIIRSEIVSRGYFRNNPVVVRFKSHPFYGSTGESIFDKTAMAADKEKEEGFVKLKVKAFANKFVKLPLYPMGDSALMSKLVMELVEKTPEGEVVLCRKIFDENVLHTWIANGRFEGTILLTSDDVECTHDFEHKKDVYKRKESDSSAPGSVASLGNLKRRMTLRSKNLLEEEEKNYQRDTAANHVYDSKSVKKVCHTWAEVVVAFVFKWDSFRSDHDLAFKQLQRADDDKSHLSRKLLSGSQKGPAKIYAETEIGDSGVHAGNRRIEAPPVTSLLSLAFNEQQQGSTSQRGSRFSTLWIKHRARPALFSEDEKQRIFDFESAETESMLDKLGTMVKDNISQVQSLAKILDKNSDGFLDIPAERDSRKKSTLNLRRLAD